jgi:nitrogen fixation NifU-like protein
MSEASAELYQAVIDDHRRRPRNRGPLPTANRVATRENPLCGDVCTLHLQLLPSPESPEARIAAARFTGAGCALSQASASLATVALAGLSPAEARALAATVESLILGTPRTGDTPVAALADLAALSAVRALPARHPCALLPWQAALAALSP